MPDHHERYELIAELLMGAAYADQELDGREHDTVRELLELATGRRLLPQSVGRRLRDFDPEKLDLASVCERLDLESEEDKRHLLELVAAVHDADEVWDLSEDAYLRSVAECLGLPESAYADLVVEEVVLESAMGSLLPPPLPADDEP